MPLKGAQTFGLESTSLKYNLDMSLSEECDVKCMTLTNLIATYLKR